MLRVVFSLFCSALLLTSCGFFFEMSKSYTPPYNPGGDFFDEDEDFARSYEIYKKRRENASGGSAQQESQQDTGRIGGFLKRKPRPSPGGVSRQSDVIERLREYGAVPVDKVEHKGGMVNSEGVDLSEVKGARFLDFDLGLKDEKGQDKKSEREKPPIILGEKEVARRGAKSHRHAVPSPGFPPVASPRVSGGGSRKIEVSLFGEPRQPDKSPPLFDGGSRRSPTMSEEKEFGSPRRRVEDPMRDTPKSEPLFDSGDRRQLAGDERFYSADKLDIPLHGTPGSGESGSLFDEAGHGPSAWGRGSGSADKLDVPQPSAPEPKGHRLLFGGNSRPSVEEEGRSGSADKPEVPRPSVPEPVELESLFGEGDQEPSTEEKGADSADGASVPPSSVPESGGFNSLFGEGDRKPPAEDEVGASTPGAVEIPLPDDVPGPEQLDSLFGAGSAGTQPIAPKSTRARRAPVSSAPTVGVGFPSLAKNGAGSVDAVPPAGVAHEESGAPPVSDAPKVGGKEEEESASEVSEASAGADADAPARPGTRRRKEDGRRALPRTSGRAQHPAAEKNSKGGEYGSGKAGDSVYDDHNFVDSWRIDSDYDDDYILQYMD
ncbi:MAG: TRP75-related protein [Anaplasma sp.]